MTSYTVINPATEQAVTEVAQADAGQADAAIERAARAQEAWRNLAPGDRARLLRSFAAAVDAHIDELAALEIAGSGIRPARPGGKRARYAMCCSTTRPRRSG